MIDDILQHIFKLHNKLKLGHIEVRKCMKLSVPVVFLL